MDLITFANLKNVELFMLGKHNDIDFSDDDISEMIQSSNACLPYIKQSIKDGEYADNPKLKELKPIPALINLAHQRYFKDIRDFVGNVEIEFTRTGNWLTANINNIKNDIALMLKEVFNLRSIEILRELFNPFDGKTYKNVIRSIGFLPGQIPPAVSGQNPHITMEFENINSTNLYFKLYSDITNTKPEENLTMTDDTYHVEDASQTTLSSTEGSPTQEEMINMQKTLEKFENEKLALQMELDKATQKNADYELKLFFDRLCHDYRASQSFIELIKPILKKADDTIVQVFENGAQQNFREALMSMLTTLLGMIKNNTIVVPTEEVLKVDPAEEDNMQMQKKLSIEEQRQNTIQEFMETGKDYKEAWALAAKKNPALF
jgi:hypothetical protein